MVGARPVCAGIRDDGAACRSLHVVPGMRFCGLHLDQRYETAREQRYREDAGPWSEVTGRTATHGGGRVWRTRSSPFVDFPNLEP